MSRLLDQTWKGALLGYCTALLLSVGMSLTVFRAFAPLQAAWPVIPLCALFTLLFYGLFQIKFPHKGLIFLGALLALGAWGMLGGGPVHTLIQMGKAAWLSFQGSPDAMTFYAGAARATVCLLFSLLGAALYWDRTVPLAVFTVVSLIGIAFLFGQQEELLLMALPAAAGVLLLMAWQDGKKLSPLPVAVLLAALAFLLLPARMKPVSPFKETAENIRHFVEDYLFFNQYRAAFSLTAEGYQPLDERLGGPAEPVDHSVMEVNTRRTVLLRGKTYDQYNGLNWYDTLSSRRYLSVSPRYLSLRETIFDLDKPLSGDGDTEPLTTTVHFLNPGTTTLFAPSHTRTLQMDGDRMVLYYNAAGEYFLTRNVEAGDSYTLTYLPLAPGSRATEALIRENAGMEDPRYGEVIKDYLQLPTHIQKEIYDLAAAITQGCETPYEKAVAIRDYLRRNYRYNLNVDAPPESVDFVAWFLIGEKQGYCTYFASAMTVLCRIAGVPARYVTGYVAMPNDSGITVVTGEHAHAWTEIYLNGFGWLEFDPTPRSDNNPDEAPEESGGSSRQEQPTPTPLPTPTPEPTQAPSDAPGETPTPAPTQEPENGPQENGPTPTPPPPAPGQASPTPPSVQPPEPIEREEEGGFPWWLVLLLALIAFVGLRVYFTEPVRRAARHPDKAPVILYSGVCALLNRRNLRRQPMETLHDFAVRADASLGKTGLPSVMPLTDAYAAWLYGRHRMDAQPFQRTYLALRKAASPWARFCLALRRVFSFRKG